MKMGNEERDEDERGHEAKDDDEKGHEAKDGDERGNEEKDDIGTDRRSKCSSPSAWTTIWSAICAPQTAETRIDVIEKAEQEICSKKTGPYKNY